MSGPDKERSSGGDDGGGGGGDEDEDGVISQSKKDELKGKAAQKSERESKRASVFRFGKAKKTLQLVQGRAKRRKRRKKKGSLVNSGCFGSCGDAVVGGCLCEKQPQTLDSSGESPCSDPNNKEFTYDMLRVFIENNDFYAEECNPHFDSD